MNGKMCLWQQLVFDNEYFCHHLLLPLTWFKLPKGRRGKKKKRNVCPKLWKPVCKCHIWSSILAECAGLSNPSVSPQRCPTMEEDWVTWLAWNAAVISSDNTDPARRGMLHFLMIILKTSWEGNNIIQLPYNHEVHCTDCKPYMPHSTGVIEQGKEELGGRWKLVDGRRTKTQTESETEIGQEFICLDIKKG